MSITWDATFETKPLDTSPDFIATTDDYLREYKSAFRERFTKEHVFDLVNQDTQGVHREGVSRAIRAESLPTIPGIKTDHAGLLWQDTSATGGLYYGEYKESSEETIYKRIGPRWRGIGRQNGSVDTFTYADIYNALTLLLPYDATLGDGHVDQPCMMLKGIGIYSYSTGVDHKDVYNFAYARRYSPTTIRLGFLLIHAQRVSSSGMYYKSPVNGALTGENLLWKTASTSSTTPVFSGSVCYKERNVE
jgi:hypothetical protein